MSIGSLGAGSGMDLESLVKKMVSAQRDAKVQHYEDKIVGYETELSALGQVGSAIDSFKSTVKTLNDDDLFSGRSATISQKEGEEVLSVTTDKTASNGAYAINVHQLAQGSRVMSAPGTFTAPDNVVTEEDAELVFQAGDNKFTLNIEAGTTLSELRNQINNADDNFGVSANLVDDGNGNLFFTASSIIQGAGNTLRIVNSAASGVEPPVKNDKEPEPVKEKEPEIEEKPVAEIEEPEIEEPEIEEPDELDLAGDDVDFANDGPIPEDEVEEVVAKAPEKSEEPKRVEEEPEEPQDSEVLEELQAENANPSINSITSTGMFAGLYTPLGEQARDAIISVDGIQIRSETNTFDDAVAGLSIEALGVTKETKKLEINYDKDTVRNSIQEFVSSYNDLQNLFSRNTSDNAPLDGNSMIRNLKSSLASEITTAQADGSSFTSIFDLGVKMDNQGMLSFDGSKFDRAAKKDYNAISPLITGDRGLANGIENLLDNYTGRGGMTNSLKDSVKGSINSTEDTLVAYEERMARYEESLRDKFTVLDSRLANMNAQGGYLNSVLSKL